VFLPGWQGNVLKWPQYCSLFAIYSHRGLTFPLVTSQVPGLKLPT
jgi:hypothetical protein